MDANIEHTFLSYNADIVPYREKFLQPKDIKDIKKATDKQI
jgi:hypothetical protein